MLFYIMFLVIVLMIVFRKIPKFLFYVVKDVIYVLKNGRSFNEFGVSIYCGRQGAGKTIAMVEYLERMKLKYPKCLILTNFDYVGENQKLDDWKKIFEVRNGEDGVIFAIDEIQNEYDSTKWKAFPEGLLREVTQQRKQRVKIICSSQVFTRVVKQLREQCYDVIECYTMGGRWTFERAFDALDYNSWSEGQDPDKKKKIHRKWRYSFIQTDEIRNKYDTFAKVQRLLKSGFQDRSVRIVK